MQLSKYSLPEIHIDIPLLLALLLLCGAGLMILFSAADQNMEIVIRQSVRLGIGLVGMLIIAQIPMRTLMWWAPWIFGFGLLMLIAVVFVGHTGKGAQRWLDLKFVKFQPSEVMKIAVPLMVAWYLNDKFTPPKFSNIILGLVIIIVPTILIARQPDLGTSILIAASGAYVLFLSGLRWRFIGLAGILGMIAAPLLWYGMKDYQKQRVLTLFDPGSDPLGAGYHIIQSKIAVGSGGLFGKGWLNGTQSQLGFLPERTTDFIFAVYCEEFGFLGVLALISLYCFIILRCLYMAKEAQGTFSRLVAGSLALTFFTYVFVNMGMVTGLLPVVGVPLPLISYGGTSIVTLLLGFGLIMSAYSHRGLMSR
ncbi:MAG: rod shape-determining protein RodA [Gammaproteobacteria bacterium]